MLEADEKAVVVERVMAHPPERIWRALTDSSLMCDWMMANDFAPEPGRCFTVRGARRRGWSGVTNCRVVAIEPPRLLVYTWGDGSESDTGVKTLVTWTLTPEDGGTRVRMEHSGFRTTDGLAYLRLGALWKQWINRLEAMVGAS